MSITFPATRTHDPVTSHEAEPSPSARSETHARILAILETSGPLTHDGIAALYYMTHGKTSATNVRSRTSELYQVGAIRAVDRDGTSATGRRATRWDVHR